MRLLFESALFYFARSKDLCRKLNAHGAYGGSYVKTQYQGCGSCSYDRAVDRSLCRAPGESSPAAGSSAEGSCATHGSAESSCATRVSAEGSGATRSSAEGICATCSSAKGGSACSRSAQHWRSSYNHPQRPNQPGRQQGADKPSHPQHNPIRNVQHEAELDRQSQRRARNVKLSLGRWCIAQSERITQSE